MDASLKGEASIPFPILRYRAGSRIDAYTSILDIAPTLVDIAGGHLGDSDGRSLDPVLAGRTGRVARGPQGIGIELLGSQALVAGRWKAVRFGAPRGDGRWGLHDCYRNLRKRATSQWDHPRVVATPHQKHDAYATRVGVVDVPADSIPYPTVFGPLGLPTQQRGPGKPPVGGDETPRLP